MIQVQHAAHSRAPREVVWQVLADLERWHEWGPWKETALEGQGVGAERTMKSERTRLTGKPYVMKERVTAFEPEDRFEYDLLSGLPIRNYHATVTLTDSNDGTDITWQAQFDPPWPILGSLWAGGMLKVIRDVADRLAAEADRRTKD